MKVLLVGYGYVGSYLLPILTRAGLDVSVCDQNVDRLTGVRNSMRCRYQELTIADLADFGIILWFAGHSSVPMSLRDPDGALANNCLDLLHFARRKPINARLIYASTASVYSSLASEDGTPPAALDETETRLDPVNPYDCSKISMDALARCFANAVTGLRLGTVCGASPFLRAELIFNAMNIAAMRDGFVQVRNRNSYRNILFLEDLAHYVLQLMKQADDLPPILNTGSLNTSIGDLADQIAAFHGVPVVDHGNGVTYSFQMNWDRIQALCGAPPALSIAERCARFQQDFRPELQVAS
ncbi:NAD(P)-dependent oxidoreductase [Hyphomicrobium sp.]|uniref:NAD-dependent epimerase/dehydratase family protein n=1 Tax=Hyphomicrobium sp. TaxID=82 RepID=UPI000F99CCF5|nr:NAD(P)-dependent oxidoreductase [Hyphomicrobium sp.]RUP00310.1 MAG: NAD(P)-dependent oxidoreductase [Hyphomicrobium sp.]